MNSLENVLKDISARENDDPVQFQHHVTTVIKDRIALLVAIGKPTSYTKDSLEKALRLVVGDSHVDDVALPIALRSAAEKLMIIGDISSTEARIIRKALSDLHAGCLQFAEDK